MLFKKELPVEQPIVKKINLKREKLQKTDRRLLLIILSGTLLLSLLFYLQPKLATLKNKISQPLVISKQKSANSFNPQTVIKQVEGLTKNLTGRYGFYVHRLAGQQAYGLNQNETFPAASLMKPPVMLLVYQEAEKGNLKLVDYQEKLEAMGQRSDNAAYNQLIKYFGQAKVQQVIDNLGMTKTVLTKDDTIPLDIGLFWQKIYQDNLITLDHQQELFAYLTKTAFEDRIPAGVPDDIRVVHKIGTEIGSYSDAGIIFASRPFILVIMSKNARESEAKTVFPQISKAIWDFENQN